MNIPVMCDSRRGILVAVRDENRGIVALEDASITCVSLEDLEHGLDVDSEYQEYEYTRRLLSVTRTTAPAPPAESPRDTERVIPFRLVTPDGVEHSGDMEHSC